MAENTGVQRKTQRKTQRDTQHETRKTQQTSKKRKRHSVDRRPFMAIIDRQSIRSFVGSDSFDANARLSGRTLLINMLRCDYTEMFPDDFKLLLTAKADVNLADDADIDFPLSLAAHHHHQH
jgi:hypothetical protein